MNGRLQRPYKSLYSTFLGAMVFVSVSCKSRSHNESLSLNLNGEQSEATYQLALTAAVSEASALKEVETSSSEGLIKQLSPNFTNLRGSWEFTLFPKVSSISERSPANLQNEFGAPVRFQFSVQRNVKCKPLYLELLGTKKWYAKFFEDVRANSQLDCAIIRVTMIADRVVNRTIDDVAEVRMYIDSRYRAHGLEIDTYLEDRRSTQTHYLPFDTHESLSSGLGVFPVDLPNLTALFALSKTGGRETKVKQGDLSLPSDPYVTRKLEPSKPDLCHKGNGNAFLISYRDYYGSKLNAGWCEGEAWPTLLETQRYFAVLTRKP